MYFAVLGAMAVCIPEVTVVCLMAFQRDFGGVVGDGTLDWRIRGIYILIFPHPPGKG